MNGGSDATDAASDCIATLSDSSSCDGSQSDGGSRGGRGSSSEGRQHAGPAAGVSSATHALPEEALALLNASARSATAALGETVPPLGGGALASATATHSGRVSPGASAAQAPSSAASARIALTASDSGARSAKRAAPPSRAASGRGRGIDRGATGGGGGTVTLRQLLRHATRREPMTGEAAFRCQRCDGHRPALRRTLLLRLPEVLVLHVGRARWQARGARSKLHHHVVFPLDGLCPAETGCLSPDACCGRSSAERLQDRATLSDAGRVRAAFGEGRSARDAVAGRQGDGAGANWPLRQPTAGRAAGRADGEVSGAPGISALPAADAVYDAVGVVRHRGRGIDTGHYVAYRREGGVGGQWLSADDQTVRPVSRAEVEAVQAFIIVYQRRR